MVENAPSQPLFPIQDWKPATHGTLIGFVSRQLTRGLSPKRKQKFENHLHQILAAHLRRYWK